MYLRIKSAEAEILKENIYDTIQHTVNSGP